MIKKFMKSACFLLAFLIVSKEKGKNCESYAIVKNLT